MLKANDQVLHGNKCQITALQSCQVSSPHDPQERAGRQIHLMHTSICASMLVLFSKGCFMWGQAGEQTMPAWPEALSPKVRVTSTQWWQSGDRVREAHLAHVGHSQSHTTSLWISSLLCHGPINRCLGSDHHNLLKKTE